MILPRVKERKDGDADVKLPFPMTVCAGEESDYPRCGAAVARTVLGAKTPRGFDPFSAIGDVLTSREQGLSFPDRVDLTADEIRGILGVLKDRTLFKDADAVRAAALIPCVENTLKSKENA